MTKEFENFKNELNFLNQTEERNKISKIESFKNQIEQDKKFLRESGIIELFQNIRDSQIVSSEEKVRNSVYKKTFFGGKEFDHYEDKIIKKPAEIIFSDNYSNNYDYSKCLDKKENNVSISLIFNHIYDYDEWGKREGGSCRIVRAVVKNHHLNLLIRNCSFTRGIKNEKDTLIPIKTGELEKNIAWAIKNAVFKGYYGPISKITDEEFY